MNNQLFRDIAYENDPHWVVKEFFNSIYQQNEFIWMLTLISERKGGVLNEDYCLFPDLSDPDPACHFVGVMFGTMAAEIVITDEQCNMYLKEACNRYLEENPDDQDQINEIVG